MGKTWSRREVFRFAYLHTSGKLIKMGKMGGAGIEQDLAGTNDVESGLLRDMSLLTARA